MSHVKSGPGWPGIRTEPREIEPSAAAPGSDEDKLESAFLYCIDHGGFFAITEPFAVWPEERSLDLSVSRIEGWVAGVPVVDGVADSGWLVCKGGRVRLVVHVSDSPEQREWVRGMAYAGAYAKEVLG